MMMSHLRPVEEWVDALVILLSASLPATIGDVL
jgi:hypothetical protein